METGKANNIQADTFNIDLCEQYHLAIEIGFKHLSYCIINTHTNSLQYLNRVIINNNFINKINQDNILKLNFGSISVSFANIPFTLVPSELFQKNKEKQILELHSNTYDIIKSDELINIKTHLIYTIPNFMNDIIFTFFPNAKQSAQQSILIKRFNEFNNHNDIAYLHISDKKFNLTTFKNSKLILSNEFDFDTKEDLLYYTLFTFEQLNLNPETVSVKIYGDIIKGDETHQLLYEYIRNVKFGCRPNSMNFPSEFNQIQQHKFYGLFSQYK